MNTYDFLVKFNYLNDNINGKILQEKILLIKNCTDSHDFISFDVAIRKILSKYPNAFNFENLNLD